MASEIILYNAFYQYIGTGVLNLETDTIKIALVTSDYVPSAAHEILADVNASPDPEVVAIASPDNGYTTGGETLSGQTVTQVASPLLSTLDADNMTWAALTATFRYGIIYADKSVGSPAIVDPLIGYILFDTTPGDIVIASIDFIIQWPADGIITWGPA